MIVIAKANDAYIAADQIENLKFGIKLKPEDEKCENLVKIIKDFMNTK